MKIFLSLFFVAIVFLLVGCVPIYQLPESTKTVNLSVSDLDSPEICIHNKWYALSKDSQGITQVPVGHRVTISNDFYISQGGAISYNTSCRPVVSFLPTKGNSYYASFGLVNTSCYLTVFKKSKVDRIGLIKVPTKKDICESGVKS